MNKNVSSFMFNFILLFDLLKETKSSHLIIMLVRRIVQVEIFIIFFLNFIHLLYNLKVH